MHSNPFGFPSADAKRYFSGSRDIPYRLEPGRKFSRRPNEMSDRNRVEPHENDVLMGRGGKNNQHSGNERLRQLARIQAEKYRTSTKKGKSSLSRLLVKQMRELDPPSRFLKKDQDTGFWEEVAEDTAREKASQVLRDAVAALSDEPGSGEFGSDELLFPDSAFSQSLVASSHGTSGNQLIQETTPALESVASMGSLSAVAQTGSPQARKRRRYSNRSEASHSYDLYSPLHIERSPLIRRNPNQPHYPLQQRQTGIQSPIRPQEVSSRSAPTGGEIAPEPGMNEFDLFHGELLESDIEEHDEPLPPDSSDLF